MIQEANLTWRYIDTESNLVMPWYVLPALEWLKKQDVKSWNVLEYGAGYSTIWWRLNAKQVASVDHNQEWATAMDAASLSIKESYINYVAIFAISKLQLDCIIVDGEWREECVEFSRYFLKPGGFMIVDNYGQTDFPPTETIDELLKGWGKQVFKQPNHTDWRTAVFQKPYHTKS